MAAAMTTSIRLPAEIRDQFETLARATGRSRNDLMVDALRMVGEHKLHELAMIQEGREQARSGRLTPIEDVVADFKRRGMLPTDFSLEDETGQASA